MTMSLNQSRKAEKENSIAINEDTSEGILVADGAVAFEAIGGESAEGRAPKPERTCWTRDDMVDCKTCWLR